ncbi:MAG: hypothetical protein JNL11_02330 [Bdellovibrionaceae bacterium]|nr:hypothetical protein [Pseudobdellovibrionaceae bacterium]
MKTIINIGLALLLSITAYAQNIHFSTNISIQTSYLVSWSKVSKFRKSLDCYIRGKGNEWESLATEKVESPIYHQGTGGYSTPVNSSVYSVAFGMQTAEIVRMNSDNKVEVSVTDNTNWSAYKNIGDSKCVIREFHWKVNSHPVKGSASVSFIMPSNTWLTRVRVTNLKGIGAQVATKIVGDLHGAVIRPTETVIWAVPGQVVTIPVSVEGNSGRGDIVRFQVGVESFGIKDIGAGENWSELRKKMMKGEGDQERLAKSFLGVSSELLRNPVEIIQMVSAMGTEDYKNLTDWLFDVANGNFPQFGAYETHVKAMSATVGYYLAMAILDDLKVFCKETDVYLPLSDRHVKMNGLLAANYFINRDVRRISGLRFPEVRAYLEELVRWENNGLKYSDIANNSKEFKKLRDGYAKIRKHSQLAFDVYGDVRLGLNKSMAVFGSYGTSQLISAQIDTQLKDLSKNLRDLNIQFEKEAMSYTVKNDGKIQASQVLMALNSLQAKSDALTEDLLAKIKFINLDPEQPNSSVIGLMTSLLAHQVAIFEKPLKSKFAEPIRNSIAQTDRAKGLNQNFRQCLGMK